MTSSMLARPRLSAPFLRLALSVTLVAALAAGCNATVQDREWKPAGDAQPSGPIDQAKSLVQRYADGEQLGSEAMGFEELVAQVTKADAGKGAKLKKFLDDALKKGVDASAAKALLKDL